MTLWIDFLRFLWARKIWSLSHWTPISWKEKEERHCLQVLWRHFFSSPSIAICQAFVPLSLKIAIRLRLLLFQWLRKWLRWKMKKKATEELIEAEDHKFHKSSSSMSLCVCAEWKPSSSSFDWYKMILSIFPLWWAHRYQEKNTERERAHRNGSA